MNLEINRRNQGGGGSVGYYRVGPRAPKGIGAELQKEKASFKVKVQPKLKEVYHRVGNTSFHEVEGKANTR